MKFVRPDVLIQRIEEAGALVTEAISRTPTSPLREELTTINILLGDCRAAIAKIMNGTPEDEVFKSLLELSQDLRKKLGMDVVAPKVFFVWDTSPLEFGDDVLEGVFESEELAQTYIDQHGDKDGFKIEGKEVLR